MTGRCLHGHHIADFQRYAGGIQIIPFAGVLELHLDHIVVGISARDILEVVEAVQLAADFATTAAA